MFQPNSIKTLLGMKSTRIENDTILKGDKKLGKEANSLHKKLKEEKMNSGSSAFSNPSHSKNLLKEVDSYLGDLKKWKKKHQIKKEEENKVTTKEELKESAKEKERKATKKQEAEDLKLKKELADEFELSEEMHNDTIKQMKEKERLTECLKGIKDDSENDLLVQEALEEKLPMDLDLKQIKRELEIDKMVLQQRQDENQRLGAEFCADILNLEKEIKSSGDFNKQIDTLEQQIDFRCAHHDIDKTQTDLPNPQNVSKILQDIEKDLAEFDSLFQINK
jgi:hypothetical protein